MIRPNYQMIRRELGRTAAIIINQAEQGILYEYIEQHKVPTLDKRVRRNWKSCIAIAQAKEQELEDNTPHPIMYEIHVNGEFYGVTRDLNVKYISSIYPYFRDALRTEKVDVYNLWSKELIMSNHYIKKDYDTE